jgi:hypothetical protein
MVADFSIYLNNKRQYKYIIKIKFSILSKKAACLFFTLKKVL